MELPGSVMASGRECIRCSFYCNVLHKYQQICSQLCVMGKTAASSLYSFMLCNIWNRVCSCFTERVVQSALICDDSAYWSTLIIFGLSVPIAWWSGNQRLKWVENWKENLISQQVRDGEKTQQLCLTSAGQEGSLTVHPFSSGKRSGEYIWSGARLQCSQPGDELNLLLQ